MKHVWILNHYANGPDTSGITRHFDLAFSLKRFGWEATLIAASIEHPSGRQRLNSWERYRHEVLSNVSFLWIRTPTYQKNGIRRILNMLAYTGRVLFPAYTKCLSKPDLIIGSSFHPFAAMAGLLLAKRYRVPFVFEVRDLWPQTLIDLGKISERNIVVWLMRRHEYWLYRNAKRIVVLLPYASDYISRLGIPKDKVIWIPNGVSLSGNNVNRPSDRTSESDSTPGTSFKLMYLGNHGVANGLVSLMHAMKLVSQRVGNEAIQLRMIGNGVVKESLHDLAKRLNLNNVVFEPAVPKCSVPVVASQADAFVITVLGMPQLYRYGISMNKLFDYLAAGRPIVIASNAANNPVLEAGSGIEVPPDDPEKLADAIMDLYQMSPSERMKMGQAGRQYVERYHNCTRLAERLAMTLDHCLVDSTHAEIKRA